MEEQSQFQLAMTMVRLEPKELKENQLMENPLTLRQSCVRYSPNSVENFPHIRPLNRLLGSGQLEGDRLNRLLSSSRHPAIYAHLKLSELDPFSFSTITAAD